ncbi:MAG: CvpA family protein [Bacteroidales bacterium]|nr:CvpA family protein [Bacteroidales bacterium]
MPESVEIKLLINLFDIIMIFLIAFGAYRGYCQGAIVQSISLFTLLVGLTICVNIAKFIHNALDANKPSHDLVAMMIVAVLFVGAIYVTMKISAVVYRHIMELTKGLTNRVLGAIFGGMKYFFITAVYLVTLFTIEEHSPFLPDNAKKSRFSAASIWLITSIFPYLDFKKNVDESTYQYMDYPNDTNNNR